MKRCLSVSNPLTLVISTAVLIVAVACSSGSSSATESTALSEEQGTPVDTSSPTPSSLPNADVLVSTLGFIRVGLDGKDVTDVYPPGVHELCVPPKAGSPPPASKEELGSPPVPTYLPEGFSLDQESLSPDGTHIGNIYVGKQGAHSGVRVTVRHGVCEMVHISNGDDSWELTPVAGNWGIFFHEDGQTTLNLTLETESGFVEIRSIDLQAKQQNRVDKDELIKIAQSFGG